MVRLTKERIEFFKNHKILIIFYLIIIYYVEFFMDRILPIMEESKYQHFCETHLA